MKQTSTLVAIALVIVGGVAYILFQEKETTVKQPSSDTSSHSLSAHPTASYSSKTEAIFFSSSSTSSTRSIQKKKSSHWIHSSASSQQNETILLTNPAKIEEYIEKEHLSPVAKIESQNILVYTQNPPPQEQSTMLPPTMPAIIKVEEFGGEAIILDSKILQTNKRVTFVKVDNDGTPQKLVTINTQKEQNEKLVLPLPPQIGE